jgi:Nif-specific regulatory protein
MNSTNKDKFEALYEVTQSISSILEPDRLLHRVLEIAINHLDAERGFLLLVDDTAPKGFAVGAARNFGGESTSESFAASSSVVQKVLSTGEPVLTFDALSDERFESSRSILAQRILSIICIPLRSHQRVIGAVYLDSTQSRGKFNEETLRFLTVFGNLSAIAIENAREVQRLKRENQRLRSQMETSYLFDGIVGESKQWREVLDLVQRVTGVDVSVLIIGESGTGKELIARAIHKNSPRASGPFVAVNCSAIPETLLESELFGHKKGAFTNAVTDKMGLIEYANGGTLFLDEIALLALHLQMKLLRVLQEREIRRVGELEDRKVDVRVIAASNVDLREEVKKGTFREDLYFRLNVVEIRLPPLRERKTDIPLLANHFVKRAAENFKRPVKSLQPKAMQRLLHHPWHGNVRELQNVIERAVVLCRGTEIEEEDLQLQHVREQDLLESGLTLEEFERQLVEKTLREMDGNRTRTAEKLGVSLRWLQYRLKEWNSEAE